MNSVAKELLELYEYLGMDESGVKRVLSAELYREGNEIFINFHGNRTVHIGELKFKAVKGDVPIDFIGIVWNKGDSPKDSLMDGATSREVNDFIDVNMTEILSRLNVSGTDMVLEKEYVPSYTEDKVKSDRYRKAYTD